ncbi:hypothetical protein D6855_03285 [Butyrivibrio sp. CB08]|uniref:DUF6115 domain-containing protein n=1 Tax=Butyrivibrio sp. CB08 TaxID=2364879 RepID=UPI000EA9AA96|nr:DUF6115 domain-containing protein [Butyrivibrio sp. CB08]RKM62449.1 hypothetical protein D6855_03285 [Butyrivibrio sp. CB08]
MISITEIVLIVAGFAAIILGYLLPAGKEMDEEDKMLMEREIRELVRREVEDQKETIDDMVGDSVENSLDRTERAMERISNEKLSAIGEYSDTVINDIHKNHDEVMFMYDMLNDKHKNLTSVVSEVTRKADEAKQVVRDAEATAKEAQEASNLLAATDEKSNVRAILLDETDDKLSGIRIPYKEKKQVVTPEPVAEPKEEPPVGNVESGYVEEKNIKELEGLDQIGARVLDKEEISSSHVIGNTVSPEPVSSKVVPITEAVRVEGRSKNPDKSMQELTANDPVSQNKQIIEMHKAGKSNMVIARELGLGIGEVKLVIDLSNKHRKVR